MAVTATQYWATLPPDQLVRELNQRLADYVTYCTTTGKLDRWQRNYAHYYGQGVSTPSSSNKLSSVGKQGEYTSLKVNDYRNLVRHQLILTTQSRPALRARATNTDYRSSQQTIVADSIIEYYLRERNHESDLMRAVEMCLVYDDSYLVQLWDASLGDILAADPIKKRPVHSGDVWQQIFGPFDVARDTGIRSGKVPWYTIRIQFNRWDLIAKFPAFRDQILAAQYGGDEYIPSTYSFLVPTPTQSSDVVDAYLFVHDPTPGLENGRLTLFLPNQWLLDGDLPYERMLVSRISPSEQDQTSFGYSDSNDLVGIQEAQDALGTIELSNQVTFGGVNIAAKKGIGLSWSQLGQGFNLFELENVDFIKPLTLNATAPNVMNLMGMLSQKAETISGVNSAARGNPGDNLTSGAAIAIVEAKAIQFMRGLEASYNKLLESWGTNIIEILKQYANEPRMIAISGKSNRAAVRAFEFTKADIANVSRVQVEAVSALSKTYSGKLEYAKDLLQSGLIKRPEQYLQLAETGRLEPLYHDQLQDLLMIQQENEALQEGEPVVALITDLHKEHIQAHRSLLNDPAVRIGDSELRERVQAHIIEHMQLLQQAAMQNPMLLWATGQEMPPMGGPMDAPPEPGAPQGAGNVSNPQSPVERQAQGVMMPKGPKNPLTGEQVDVPPQIAGQPA
jgi:hypothetical protein